MNIAQMKTLALNEIDAARDEILTIATALFKHPQTGFNETYGSDLIAEKLTSFGFAVERRLALTGVRARTNPHSDGPRIAFMGELDSIINPAHPYADPETGACHACGHSVQTTVMLGLALALQRSGVLPQLNGGIDFIAVPAEEVLELEFRDKLISEGKIQYYSGKQEFIRIGLYDDVDMAMMLHSYSFEENTCKTSARNTGTGFIAKKIKFIGKETHAAASPWEGINALNMANLAMQGINAQRETFRDEDHVRIHSIITKGGDIVNSIPADVRMELFVRAANIPAIKAASTKVDHAVHGAAVMLGGHAEITDMPGYMPVYADKAMAAIYAKNAEEFYSKEQILSLTETSGSFDIGDLSLFMPILHPLVSGVSGGLHSREFKIIDDDDAYIIPIKIMACTVIDLLANDAQKARNILSSFKPKMTREEYLAHLEDTKRTIRF